MLCWMLLRRKSTVELELRKRMVRYALRYGVSAAAAKFETTRKTVRKWRDRYLAEGVRGLGGPLASSEAHSAQDLAADGPAAHRPSETLSWLGPGASGHALPAGLLSQCGGTGAARGGSYAAEAEEAGSQRPSGSEGVFAAI